MSGARMDVFLAVLERLSAEMVWRVDNGQATTVHELFTDDGILRLGPTTVLEGTAAIEAWGRERAKPTKRSIHVCSNYRYRSTGEQTAAGTCTVCVYSSQIDSPTPVRQVIGEYTDEFRNEDGQWRFASRLYETLMSFDLAG